jgi:hypothetical protein
VNDDHEVPSVWELEEKAEQLVSYFEKVEETVSERTDRQPIHLVETQIARDLSVGLSRLESAEREQRLYWKHRDPDEMVLGFVALVGDFIKKEGISWEELERRLGIPSDSLSRLKWFADDDE